MIRFQRRSICLLATLGTLVLTVIIGNGQSSDGNVLVGKVRTRSGQTMANVIVQLESGNGVIVAQTVTSNEGDYAFGALSGASFVLVVSDVQHEPFAERVEFTRQGTTRPGETLRADITLVPKSRTVAAFGGVTFRQEVPEPALKEYHRGLKLLSELKAEEGMAALNEATRLFPRYFDAYFALGLEMFKLHRYDDSIKELEKARTVNPRDSRLYYAFGLVLYEQKKYAMAARVFQECEKLDPRNAEARLMRAAALIDIGQLEEADSELKDADRLSSRKLVLVHIQRARLYEKRGEKKRAADELEEYLRQNPNAENAGAIREAVKKLRSK